MKTITLNPFPENISVIQEEGSTVVQYVAMCDGRQRFCQHHFAGLFEFESINERVLTLKEIE